MSTTAVRTYYAKSNSWSRRGRADLLTGDGTLPTAPTALAASGAGAAVTVTWAAPTGGGSPVTGYTVARDGVDTSGGGPWGTTVAASVLVWTFDKLQAGTAYTFTVTATTAQGSGPPATVSFATAGGTGGGGTTAPTAPPQAASAGYSRSSFADEFTDATLDTTKWGVNNYSLSYELSQNLPANVFLRGGNLVIAAKRETTPNGRNWSSGYIDTRNGKFAQQYGYFEVRARVNTTAVTSAGLWPSPLWMRPNDTSFTGEIDVLECWGEPSVNADGSTRRTDYRSGQGQMTILADTMHTDNRKVSNWTQAAGSPRLSDGFNTFGFLWTPSQMSFWFNDVLVGGPWDHTALPYYANYLTPFHLRVQMQVGQDAYWGVPNVNTQDYSEMLIDWVRVWASPNVAHHMTDGAPVARRKPRMLTRRAPSGLYIAEHEHQRTDRRDLVTA